MGFRFQRGVSLIPGLRVNRNKGGASLSICGRGAWCTIGAARARQQTIALDDCDATHDHCATAPTGGVSGGRHGEGSAQGQQGSQEAEGGQTEGFRLGLQAVAGQRRSSLEPDRDEEGLSSRLSGAIVAARPLWLKR
jgi:hypothetical protein